MTEQTIEVVKGNAVVSPVVSGAVPAAATEGASVGRTQFRRITHRKSLAERVSEAYGDDLEHKERELLDRAANQFGQRLSSEE